MCFIVVFMYDECLQGGALQYFKEQYLVLRKKSFAWGSISHAYWDTEGLKNSEKNKSAIKMNKNIYKKILLAQLVKKIDI